MGGSPAYKVYSADRKYVASCKYAEDAAAVVGLHGEGACVKWKHKFKVWVEGSEQFTAADSYDGAAAIIRTRVTAKTKHRAL